MIGTFFIKYIFVVIFNNKYYKNTNLYNVITDSNYQNKLNNYIDSKTLLITLIISSIFIPIFYLILKKNKTSAKFKLSKISKYILLVTSIYNTYLSIITNYQISSLPIFIQIICSGIIGPIIEELLFRGIVYNKLKEITSSEKSMLISTIIFSLLHFSLSDIIYTFILGIIFVYIYEKNNNIKYPIIVHISANISVILLSIIISLKNIFINVGLIVINLLILLLIYSKNQLDKKNI